MPYLRAVNGSAAGQRYELDRPVSLLGRHPDCHVVLEPPEVSRQHARIVCEGEQCQLEDLGSRNRTFLNGQMIQRSEPLTDGDVIRICEKEFTFHRRTAPRPLESMLAVEGSSFGVVMVDDTEEPGALAVASKREIRGSGLDAQVAASAETQLVAVLEIMRHLGRAVSLSEVLPKVLDSLFKIFLVADRGFIVLRLPDGTLQPKWLKTRRPDQEETARFSRTILQQVIDKREAILSLDDSNDSRFDRSESLSDFRIRSMIVAPLLDSDGQAIGAIQVDSLNQRGRFEPRDLEVLMAVASQAGLASEKAQLHEQLLQQKLLEQDLRMASQVQQGFLPREAICLPGYQFFQFYQPALHIGGDYFDYIWVADDRLAVVVADVVGHGIAAAMFMAKLSAETRFALARLPSLSDAIALLNNRLISMQLERFVTMCITLLHPASGRVEVVNAGHMAPIWRQPNGTVNEPSKTQSSLPLGILEDEQFASSRFQLEPGASLLLYTDGIFEAENPAGQPLGIARIQRLMGQTVGEANALGQRLVQTVRGHVGPSPQADDMCAVVLSRDAIG